MVSLSSITSGKKMPNILVDSSIFQNKMTKMMMSMNKVVQAEMNSTVTLTKQIHILGKGVEKKDQKLPKAILKKKSKLKKPKKMK